MRYRHSEARAIARGVSVLVFLGAALLSLFAAMIEEAEGAYTWSDRYVVALLIFSGASLVAAGVAAFPGRSVTLRALGVLSLAPAVMLMSEYKGSPESKWLAVAAVALVVTGGLVAGVAMRSKRRLEDG